MRVDPATLPAAFSSNLPLARPGRCHGPLRDLPEEKIISILDAAAQFRLQRKALRLQRLTELHGNDEALFQELAATLGYKQNKLPFTLLAQRLPLKGLRIQPDEIESVLFGVAGFLGGLDLAGFAPGTRQYLRVLWDRWWPQRAELERLILPPRTWRLSGTRPQSSAAPPRRACRHCGGVAATASVVRQRKSRRRKKFLSRTRASLLEFPLHAHLGGFGGANGLGWRNANH